MNGKINIFLIHLNLAYPTSHFMSAAKFTQKTPLVHVFLVAEKFTKLNCMGKDAWAGRDEIVFINESDHK